MCWGLGLCQGKGGSAEPCPCCCQPDFVLGREDGDPKNTAAWGALLALWVGQPWSARTLVLGASIGMLFPPPDLP